MKYLVPAMLVVVGVIHLLPMAGVTGGDRLAALYGVTIESPELEILMRHRAILFGLLGAFLIYAAFKPALQPLAVLAGAISTVSFLVIAAGNNYGDGLARVVTADVIAVACLAVAAGALVFPSLAR